MMHVLTICLDEIITAVEKFSDQDMEKVNCVDAAEMNEIASKIHDFIEVMDRLTARNNIRRLNQEAERAIEKIVSCKDSKVARAALDQYADFYKEQK